jgi:hypothetical protein
MSARSENMLKGIQPGTQQAIQAMNAKAAEFCSAIDAFDRIARDRIRGRVTPTWRRRRAPLGRWLL